MEVAQDLHAGIPGSELVIFEHSGHMTYVEQPEDYCAAVRDFFRRNTLAAPSVAAR